jgi:hypothetical protein
MTNKRSFSIPMNDNVSNLAQSRRKQQTKGIFGCPICHLHSGYYQIGREYWFYCHVHRTKWSDDAFWTDSWPTPAESFCAIDQLAGYREVEPWYWPVDGTEEEKAEWERNLVTVSTGVKQNDDDVPF